AGGPFRVDAVRLRAPADELSRQILVLQGNDDYAGVVKLYADLGAIGPQLQADLDRLKAKGIPVDIVYDQGR
ncbi:MAG: Zn-dependent hydrolase, partial [Polaromonas sp.]|nr:Zn-dependent hydrolase [Gemmatimonadaceae bacterium]